MKPFGLAMLLVLMAIAPLHAQDDEDDTPSLEDTPHITITGTASREAVPDLATVTLGVTSHKAQAMAAEDAVAVAATSVVDAAKTMGVAPADIATRAVSLQQSYEDIRDSQGHTTGRIPSGFDAANSVAIRIRDLGKAGRIAQAMIDHGANSLESVVFTVEHPEPIRDELDVEAAADARRKAGAIAQAAGAKLGRVLLIVRPGTDIAPRARTFSVARARSEPVEVPLEAGTTTMAARMEVTWALEK